MWDPNIEGDEQEAQKVVQDFTQKCHPKPDIQLNEDETPTHFLETEIIATQTNIEFKHWNKNFESIIKHGKQRVLSGQHPNSYTPRRAMMGTMIGDFTRVMRNSDAKHMQKAINEKAYEHKWIGHSMNTVYRAMKHTLTTNSNLAAKRVQVQCMQEGLVAIDTACASLRQAWLNLAILMACITTCC